jgi:hypothetical protein
VITNNGRLLSLFETIINDPQKYSQQEGTLTRKISEYLATNEEMWRALLHVVGLSTYTLVDLDRMQNGKLAYLTITTQERANLLKQLEKSFPDDIKGGPKAGQYPIEGSAALLWSFLNEEWKASDCR